MAARAAVRERRRAAERDAQYPQPPAIPGHEDHHTHANMSGGVVCSCGLFLGQACIVPDSRFWSEDPAEVEQARREDEDFRAWVTCRVCGQTGVVLDDDFGAWPPRRIS